MEPQITVRLTGNRQKALKTFKRYFPNHTPQQVAAAAGFLPGSTVHFAAFDSTSGGSPTLNLDDLGSHPDLNLVREFGHVSDGKGGQRLAMHASSQEASSRIRGKGYERFKDTVEGLREVGVHEIHVGYAPRGSTYNGYHTWPRFGFQGAIPEDHFQKLPDEVKSQMGDKRDFHSLFAAEGGPEAWKKVGGAAYNLHFDLHPESEHSQRFASYYEQRKAKEQQASAPQPPVEGQVQSAGNGDQSVGVAGSTRSAGTQQETPHARKNAGLYRLSDLLLRYRQEKASRFSCVYLPVKGELRERVLALAAKVPADLLAADGREDDPHITLFYGLHTDDPTEVAGRIACLRSPLQYRLGGLAVFEKGDYDVLYLTVSSPVAVLLNYKLRALPYSTDYPRYVPHCTVACVRSGEGWRLAKALQPVNEIGECSEAVFSDPDHKKTTINLLMTGDRYMASDAPTRYNETDVTRETKVAPVRPNQQQPPKRSINDLIAAARQRSGGNRVDEDLRLFKKSFRSQAVFAGPQPNSTDERAALATHAVNRGLKVVQSPVTAYDEDTHTLYHPTPEDKAAVGEAYVKWGTGVTKFRFGEAPIRYADGELPAHSLVAGFRIEHALRHIATDPSFTESGRLLAKRALVDGDADALYPLHDELTEFNHPLAYNPETGSGYNFAKAASAIHLDAAVGHAIDAIRQRAQGPASPMVGTNHMRAALLGIRPAGLSQYESQRAAEEAVQLLKSQGHSADDLIRSIDRHARRNMDSLGVQRGIVTPEEVAASAVKPALKGDPTRYRQSPAVSDFIQAVRQLRSSNQEVRRTLAEKQFAKLKLDVQAIRDAVADAPHTASANTAAHIMHSDRERVLAAASLYGLQTNSPSLLVFHNDDEGPDSLYKWDVTGSAEKLRRRMDQAGLTNRTLLPTETGWSALIFDAGGNMRPVVEKFVQSEGASLQVSRGVGQVIGSGDEAEGDSEDRKTYRQIIRRWERSQKPNANIPTQQPAGYNPAHNQPAGAVAAPAGQPAGAGAAPTAAGATVAV